jgi:hypothetical protein
MAASMSTNSWRRHGSALSCARTYAHAQAIMFSWPLDATFIRGFVSWALEVKKLNPRTVTVYLSDLELAHGLRGFNTDHFDDIFVKK